MIPAWDYIKGESIWNFPRSDVGNCKLASEVYGRTGVAQFVKVYQSCHPLNGSSSYVEDIHDVVEAVHSS